MKTNIRKLQKQRIFSEEFKRKIVNDFESGRFSVRDLSRLHGMSRQCVYYWIYKFSNFNDRDYRIVEMKDSSDKKVKQLEQKIKELERMVGQKQIKIDYLEKMIEIADDELSIDIKKNSNTPPSAGSGKTKNK